MRKILMVLLRLIEAGLFLIGPPFYLLELGGGAVVFITEAFADSAHMTRMQMLEREKRGEVRRNLNARAMLSVRPRSWETGDQSLQQLHSDIGKEVVFKNHQ